jgi:RNA polymerase sigma-70 factor (ECF subfamily)
MQANARGDDSALASSFRSTRWSLVERARGADDRVAREALEDLLRSYQHPLYAFLRRSGLALHDAEDALQSFYARLIEGRERWAVDPERGRFRAWLLGALRHHVADQRDRERAAKRGGGQVLSFDAAAHESRYAHESRASEDPERLYERLWSLEVAAAALERLYKSELAAGRGSEWNVLAPFLSRSCESGEYEQAAGALGKSEVALKVAVHRLRERYRGAFEDEVRETLSDGSAESLRDELRLLLAALSG